MTKIFFKIIGLSAFVFLLASCTHSVDNPENIQTVCFEKDVLPIFQTNCALSGCHSSSSAEEGIVLDSYQNIIKHVKPNSAKDSPVYEAITDSWGEIMPPNGPLSKENRTAIFLWIEQGAKNNSCK